MKSSMSLTYVADTLVRITVEANVEGIVISTTDGEHENHFSLMLDDTLELSEMLAKAALHVSELNKEDK